MQAMKAGRALVWALALSLVLLLALPIAGLVAQGFPALISGGLVSPIVWNALWVSLGTSLFALLLVIVLGTPLAWLLARSRTKKLAGLELLVQLPIVLPPSLAGLALLFAFGRRGLLGSGLEHLGISLAFTKGAVILAQLFVASPYYVQAAASAFRSLDEKLLEVARTLGASPARIFFRLVLPLCASALRGGAVLAWARALGEFGATLLFAGNLPGATQTLPLAIVAALESDLHAAAALGLLLLALALTLLFLARRSLRSGVGLGELV
jgi:molybdate transport system permease protein